MPASVWFEPRFADTRSIDGSYDISLRENGGGVWDDVLVSIEGFPIESEQSYRETQAPGTDSVEQGDQQAKFAPTAEDVLTWFRDVWKPACDKKGFVPARDMNQLLKPEINDLDAAKDYSGCNVNRNFVRAARGEVAPEWTKRGRRSTKN